MKKWYSTINGNFKASVTEIEDHFMTSFYALGEPDFDMNHGLNVRTYKTKASAMRAARNYIKCYENMYKVVTFDGVEYVSKSLIDIAGEMINNGYGSQDVILRKGNVDIKTLEQAFSDFYGLLEEASFENEETKQEMEKLKHDYIDTDSVQEKNYFIGKEHYQNLGFFDEKNLEELLWKVLEITTCVNTENDLQNLLDMIANMDNYLESINNYKPFSDNDKKIFNSQILLSRLKGLVTFTLWNKNIYSKGGDK